MPYIFIDPDGTQENTLHVLVQHPTGVEYAHQCAGYVNEERSAEGFLIPLGESKASQPLIDWFWKRFKGNSYPPLIEWDQQNVSELKDLVQKIPCWFTAKGGEADRRTTLALDEDRMGECVEGWVPVKTPFGPGILVFENCD